MKFITFKAHYDGKHICPDEPCDIPANTKLIIAVAPDSFALDKEREAWLAASQEALARAYGDDEPDYSHCVGKFPPE